MSPPAPTPSRGPRRARSIRATVYADLHVHVGSAGGRPVKIAASRELTVAGILRTAKADKGLDIVGVIDAITPTVAAELAAAVAQGTLVPLPGGGLRGPDGLVLLLGGEIELLVAGQRVHFLAFVPGLSELRGLAQRLRPHLTNPTLSTQRAHGVDPDTLCGWADASGGACWPAHAFTPHRGLYGCAVRSVRDELGPALAARFPAMELGLSADTAMADRISELRAVTFLSSSDAHSLGTIGRESNALTVRRPDWEEVALALRRNGGCAVIANYGLDPALGKYHRTSCLACGARADVAPPVLICPRCGSPRVVRGVADRMEMIADLPAPSHPAHRPPYIHQIPLRMLPGVGPAMVARLLREIGPEHHVLHRADIAEIAAVAGAPVADAVRRMRADQTLIEAGGGGRYGRVQRSREGARGVGSPEGEPAGGRTDRPRTEPRHAPDPGRPRPGDGRAGGRPGRPLGAGDPAHGPE